MTDSAEHDPKLAYGDASIAGALYEDLSSEESTRRTIGGNRRRAGAILGLAVGDALGAPYEFKPSQGITLTGTSADMIGGGSLGWEPGEWTDDTSMAIPLLRARRDNEWGSADQVLQEWRRWALSANDVGIQTREVLGMLDENSTATDASDAAATVHYLRGRSGGNGSLMRTAPVGLQLRLSGANAFSPARTVHMIIEEARSFSSLTHFDPGAADACVLWSIMIHMATTHGVVDPQDAVKCLPRDRRGKWTALLDEAASSQPGDFPNNGWVIHALQAAWSAIHVAGFDVTDERTATPQAFRLALQHAINAGDDTDTVAAITGALAGALVGADAIPLGWQRLLHGWGGEGVVLDAGAFVRLAADAHANQGGDRHEFTPRRTRRVDYSSWGPCDTLVRHPHDVGVLLGGVGVLDALPDHVDAVVSLCRIGDEQVPERIACDDKVEVWLVDRPEPAENPHLEFVLGQAADAVAEFRAAGKTVLLHGVQAQSRTAVVAALYASRHLRVAGDVARAEVREVLPSLQPSSVLREAFVRITCSSSGSTRSASGADA